jgi:hypothetical protein
MKTRVAAEPVELMMSSGRAHRAHWQWRQQLRAAGSSLPLLTPQTCPKLGGSGTQARTAARCDRDQPELPCFW